MKTFIGVIAIFAVLACASGLTTTKEVAKPKSVLLPGKHMTSLFAGVSSLPALNSYSAFLKYIPQIGEWNACFVNSPWQNVVVNAFNFLDCTNLDEAETWSQISEDVSTHVKNVQNINITDYCSYEDFDCIFKTLTSEVENIPSEIASVLKADVKCFDSSINESLSMAKAAAENIAECLCNAGFPCK